MARRGTPLDARTLLLIQNLRRQGVGVDTIARQAELSPITVKKYTRAQRAEYEREQKSKSDVAV